MLTGPGKKRASDEAIYDSILAGYTQAREQRARMRKWRADEVAAFAQHFKEVQPSDYTEFLRQEMERTFHHEHQP